jgi:ribosome-associated protein
MDIRKLQRAIVDGLEDVKARDIVVFNTEALSPLFERVIIASGTSNRQTKALAAGVRDAVKERGLQVLRTEGEENGEWIIVDCGAAVAHIMQPAIRDYYHLEEIWGGKSVKMKIGDGKAAKKTAVKARLAEEVPVAKKAAAKPEPAKKAAARVAAKKASRQAPTKAASAAKPASARAGGRAPTRGAARSAPDNPPKKKPATKSGARKTAGGR